MMNMDELKAIPKSEIPQAAVNLTADEVDFLVSLLSEKEETARYHAFLLLQENSRLSPYVFKHWKVLEAKLSSHNSYQRSLGAMLLAENVRWDKEAKFQKTFAGYLACCADDKFVTSRQSIIALAHVLKATDKYDAQIKQGLSSLTLTKYKENQQSILKRDITAIIKFIESKKK